MFNDIYKNKTVLITGHTGFKGSWLAFWLKEMGAKVIGMSLEEDISTPNHYQLLNLDLIESNLDINHYDKVQKAFDLHNPDIVFHLAAQSLVLRSYENPLDTFRTNILGTANIFEACRKNNKVKAIVNITSDKVYANQEWSWGYRENDTLGGKDPYSASKAAVELVTNSYRDSFFQKGLLLASCRAGNVIGGGDWAEKRLIPDLMRGAINNTPVKIRYPQAVRPWQHVLEPLSGYLLIGQKLLEGQKVDSSWNFGPSSQKLTTVLDAINCAQSIWPAIKVDAGIEETGHHEAGLLNLDCSRAINQLNWSPVWDIQTTFEKTINWYKEFYLNKRLLTQNDLNNYFADAAKKNLSWAK